MHFRSIAASFLLSFVFAFASARGSIIVDQPPLSTGGPGADTSFVDDGGISTWQQVADDIVLSEPATIRKIVWWGFYGGSFGPHEDPPSSQSIRIRFYDSRPGDGLPGSVLYEEGFLNPSRTSTGHTIAIPSLPAEQRFEIELATSYELFSATHYWLEILQLGDISSAFRWEFSPGNQTPFAFKNLNSPDWRYTGATSNLAFELLTIPEPTSISIVLFGAAVLALTGPKARKRLDRNSIRIALSIVSFLFSVSSVSAGIFVDQQPLNTGGSASDTSFVNDGGFSTWQQLADDFRLNQPATAQHLQWFGFYGGDYSGPEYPPLNEAMRVRFYDSRFGDGLPGRVLFEETFSNPSRAETGRLISGPGAQPEQRFEVVFSQPLAMEASIQYWLEIVQFGDVNSHFRWEYSPGNETPFAFINPNLADWRRTTVNGNLAFQLSNVPEPAILSLLVIGAAGLALTRPKAR